MVFHKGSLQNEISNYFLLQQVFFLKKNTTAPPQVSSTKRP